MYLVYENLLSCTQRIHVVTVHMWRSVDFQTMVHWMLSPSPKSILL